MANPYGQTRNKQLVRVLRLLALLEDGWCHLDRLTAELSVSSRTVRRDLAAIAAAGLPLRKGQAGNDERAYWRMARKAA